MVGRTDRLVESSGWTVRSARLMNWIFFGAVLLGLLLSFVLSTQFARILLHSNPGVDVRAEMAGLRWLMVLGAAMAVATGVLPAALGRMIASVRAGDPFVAANAVELRTIGWALLAFQLLDVPGALIAKFFPSLGSAGPEITFSPGGWLAVLLAFALSRVFAAGAVMKDELEGTV